MGSVVNVYTPDIPEIDQTQKISDLEDLISDLEDLPYTKFPNVWLDVLRYKLPPMIRVAVECIFRDTIGQHGKMAEIANWEFADYMGVGLTTARKAIKAGIDIGIIVRVRQGTGLKTSIYGVNLDYDSGETKRISEPPIQKEAKVLDLSDSKPQTSQKPELSQKPEKKDRKKPKKPTNQAKSRVLPSDSSYKDLDKKDLDLDKKTNRDDSSDSEKRKKIGRVCSLLRDLGFEITDRVFGFLKKMISRYGFEKILEKIRIMRSQMARNIVIERLCAWLHSALKRDFQPYDVDAKKIEADAAREREIERAHIESENREIERQKLIEAGPMDPEKRKQLNALSLKLGLGPLNENFGGGSPKPGASSG